MGVLQRSDSIESTMSEKEFTKKYQQITHRYKDNITVLLDKKYIFFNELKTLGICHD